MKKVLMSVIFVCTFALLLTGCTTSKSYTFKVETGDEIEVKLNTNDGYDITSDLPFSVLKDEETLSQGTFITIDQYKQYISSVNNDSNAKIIESTTKNDLEYIFYSYNDSEWNYVIKISDSSTGLLIGNPISEESARECFNRLTINKK